LIILHPSYTTPATRHWNYELSYIRLYYCFNCMLSFFCFFHSPPIFSLFPYTTLFRSRRLRARIPSPHNVQYILTSATLGGKDAEDRKSTRLNSSHVSISYAVFCLKKKKKIANHTLN